MKALNNAILVVVQPQLFFFCYFLKVVKRHSSVLLTGKRPLTQLFQFLYVGSVRYAHNVELLEELGVTHVLNCAARECSKITADYYLVHGRDIHP